MAFVKMRVDTTRVQAMIRRESLKGRIVSRYTVTYPVNYAVYVHEDLQAYHAVGQAKFLEEPARRLAPLMGRRAAAQLRHKKSLDEAMRANAEVLLEASQPLVPVDTGRLKESGRVRKLP